MKTELIEKAKNGDKNATEELLKTTEKESYSFLYYLLKSENDISDIVQEILLKVSKNISGLKDVKTFKPWLNKIILRTYYDFIRKNKKNNQIVELTDETPEIFLKDRKNCPVDDCIKNELNNIIKKSILKLKEEYKIAITLREFEGLSYDEIAKLTNTNVGTVKSRIARARCQLKEYIKPFME